MARVINSQGRDFRREGVSVDVVRTLGSKRSVSMATACKERLALSNLISNNLNEEDAEKEKNK